MAIDARVNLKKYLSLGILFFSFGVTSFWLTVAIFNPQKKAESQTISEQPIDQTKVNQFKLALENKQDKSINLLLLGYGGAGHDGGYLTDVVKIVSIDPFLKRVNVISIPRDLWVPIPVRSDAVEWQKINAAYAIGMDNNYPLKQTQYRGEDGARKLVSDVVNTVTGFKVDYVAATDFSGFEALVDQLGGIEVNVPVSFTDKFYPIKGKENELCGMSPQEINEAHEKYSGFELEKQFQCRYETLEFRAGPTKMDGTTALKFVRSRHSGEHGGDFARASRQAAVLQGIKDKAISLRALDDLPGFWAVYKQFVSTNLTAEAVLAFLAKYPDVRNYEVKNILLTTDNVLKHSTSSAGAYILTPKAGSNNWTEISDYILRESYAQ